MSTAFSPLFLVRYNRLRTLAYPFLTVSRYAIDDGSADWAVAEAQVRNTLSGDGRGKSTVVSVKTTGAAGQKRKLDDATPAADVKSKKNRRSLSKKR